MKLLTKASLLSIILFCGFMSEALLASSSSTSTVAIATFVRGRAYYVREGKKHKVRIKTIFNKNDKIFTYKGKINIQVGPTAILRLSEYSILEMKDLYEGDDIRRIALYVSQGRLYSKIVKKLNKGSSFRVHTPTSVAAVRGTQFLVSENSGSAAKHGPETKINSGIYVKKGIVAVSSGSSGDEISVKADEQVVITSGKELKKGIIDSFIKRKMKILEGLTVMKEKNYKLLKAQIEKDRANKEKIINKNKELLENMK